MKIKNLSEGLNAQQRSVPQLPAQAQAKKISVLGAKTDPKHPFAGYMVGANESADDNMPDLETVGEPVKSLMDAERRMAAGDRIFVAHEMDDEPFEIFNVDDLKGYTYDQMLAVPQDIAEGRAGVDDTDTVGFSVNSEAAYNAVMRRFGDAIDHDETSGIMYVPARLWPQIEMTAFDADPDEGAVRVEDDVMETGAAEGEEHIVTELAKSKISKKSGNEFIKFKVPGNLNTTRNISATLANMAKKIDDESTAFVGIPLSSLIIPQGKSNMDLYKVHQFKDSNGNPGKIYATDTESPSGFSIIIAKVKQQGVAEGEEQGTFAALKGWQQWNVLIRNNFYNGKYPDYSARLYGVVASSPEEARQVVLDNADYVLKDLLSRKTPNGKRWLPPKSAVPIEDKRVGSTDMVKPGSLTTMGFKTMLTPEGSKSMKFSNGQIVDIQGEESTVAEGLDQARVSPETLQVVQQLRKQLSRRTSLQAKKTMLVIKSDQLGPQDRKLIQDTLTQAGITFKIKDNEVQSVRGGSWKNTLVGIPYDQTGVAEAERNELDTPAVQAALARMAERHRGEKWSKEQLAALGKRIAARGQKTVKEDVTKEDVISKLKAKLGDYLSDLSKEIKSDPDLVDKLAAKAPGDQMGPPVKTVTTDDGHEIQIHGNEDDGFRISIKNKQSASKFANVDEAVMACEMYCARRRSQTLNADYVEEA